MHTDPHVSSSRPGQIVGNPGTLTRPAAMPLDAWPRVTCSSSNWVPGTSGESWLNRAVGGNDSGMNRMRAIVKKIENARALDTVAAVADRTIGPLLGTRSARYVLGGVWLGHRVHPLLVTVPIGSWTSALLLDLTRNDADAARRLVGFGALTAVPSALTGWSDWTQANGSARRVGVAHAAANGVAIALFSGSYLARGRSRSVGTALAVAGAGALSIGGYLGGHLTYVQGVGVEPPTVGMPAA